MNILKRFRSYSGDEKILLLLTLSGILSITLLEISVALFFLYFLLKTWKVRFRISLDSLGLSFLIQAIPTILVNFFYLPKYIPKAIERGLFPLIYLYRFSFNQKDSQRIYSFLRDLYHLLLIVAILLIPLVFYHNWKLGFPKALWGGIFEVSFLYSFFLLISISLYIYTGRKIYLFFSLLFFAMIYFSARRSTFLGLILTGLLILYQGRDYFGLTLKRFTLIVVGIFILSTFILSGAIFYLFGKHFPQHRIAFEVLTGKRELDLKTLDAISSVRIGNALAGIEVIKRDIKEGNLRVILFGHGLYPGERLTPKPVEGRHYESVILISEYLEKGIVGVVGIILMFIMFYRFMLKLKYNRPEDFLFMPLASMFSIHLIASTITLFWDALLPLYLLYFRFVEIAFQQGFFHRERHTS